MGWSSQAILASVILVEGDQGGVFIYDGSGNLVDSMAFAPGVDPLTKSNLIGITNYFTGAMLTDALQLSGGNINWLTAPAPTGPFSQAASINLTSIVTPSSLAITSQSIILGSGITTVLIAASGDATGAADTAAVAAAFTTGRMPVLLPGTFNINCGNATLTALGPGQYITGCGYHNTIINALGSGDLFYWSFSGTYNGQTTTGGGIKGGMTIDGTGTTGTATGIHAGDIESLEFEAVCQNFNAGSASWGFLFDNQNHFTERMKLDIQAKSCGNTPGNGGGVGFNVGGATTSTNSFKGLDARIYITSGSNQRDGLVLSNGAQIYDARVFFSGNFATTGGATTAAAVRISGTVPAGHPNAGLASNISNSELVWTPEAGSGGTAPFDLVLATSGNTINRCAGLMDWGSNFAQASMAAGTSFVFDGQVTGDSKLGTRRALGEGNGGTAQAVSTGSTIEVGGPNGASEVITVSVAAASTGVILRAGTVAGQQVTVVNTGTNSITFAASGTSNVADGVADVIATLTSARFIWDSVTTLWYRSV